MPPEAAVSLTSRPVEIIAADGYSLSGLLTSPANPVRAAMVSSATGFPKAFYRRFAEYGAARGAAVLTYDYRGIADSAPADLAAMDMDYTDWGRLDMPAAARALADATSGLPMVHTGHSAGGHFLGFMDNHALIRRHAFVSVGSGYWGHHHLANRPLELFFWLAYGAACLAAKGHIPAGGPWRGTALPRGVFTTWRRWCLKRAYFRDELKDRLAPNHFGEVTAPIRSWIFPDDPIATPRTGQAMLDLYAAAPRDMVVRSPQDVGVSRIGHEGAFRGGREALWDEIWSWLELD